MRSRLTTRHFRSDIALGLEDFTRVLFGTFGAADVFYAPVVSRFVTYGVGVPGFAQAYMEAMWEHEWMQAWIKAAEDEQWVIEQWDTVPSV